MMLQFSKMKHFGKFETAFLYSLELFEIKGLNLNYLCVLNNLVEHLEGLKKPVWNLETLLQQLETIFKSTR